MALIRLSAKSSQSVLYSSPTTYKMSMNIKWSNAVENVGESNKSVPLDGYPSIEFLLLAIDVKMERVPLIRSGSCRAREIASLFPVLSSTLSRNTNHGYWELWSAEVYLIAHSVNALKGSATPCKTWLTMGNAVRARLSCTLTRLEKRFTIWLVK